jgi:predicted dehydrogenase
MAKYTLAMTEEAQVRIALVGLNFGARWISAYQQHPNVAAVALCDTNETTLHQVADSHGIEDRYTRLDDILESDKYDAVHLFTPIPLHAEQTIATLSASKHCACAIPMAVRLEDVRLLVETQRRSGKNYMLMETEAYSPTFMLAKTLYDAGKFGELQLLRGVHYQNMEGWPGYWMGLPPMSYCYHGLGPVLHLLGKRATHVTCLGSGHLPEEMRQNYGNPFPVESALFQLEDTDVVCEVTSCLFKMVRPHLTDRFYIYGDRLGFESAQISGGKPVLFEAEKGVLSEGQRGRKATVQYLDVPELSESVEGRFSAYVRQARFNQGVLLVHEFIRSIVEKRPPSLDVLTAANWTAAGTGAHESAMRGGEKVTIPPFD